MKLLKAKLILLAFLALVALFAPLVWIWNVVQVIFAPRRGLEGCHAWDVTGATIAWGVPGKTISYLTAKASQSGNRFAIWVCEALGDVMPGHCASALKGSDFTLRSLE